MNTTVTALAHGTRGLSAACITDPPGRALRLFRRNCLSGGPHGDQPYLRGGTAVTTKSSNDDDASDLAQTPTRPEFGSVPS